MLPYEKSPVITYFLPLVISTFLFARGKNVTF